MNKIKTNINNRKLADILSDLNLNISTNPKGTDKGDYKTYVKGFYEKEFAPRKTNKNKILEVGVRSGASIALWANFFDNAEIIGVDVESVGSLVGPLGEYLNYSSVKFFCEDAYSQEFADSITDSFDILIDDGPHSLASQKKFLQLYLPKMSEDGVLIIEDIQRNYRDIYQLTKTLPKGNKFIFEIYDFRKYSRTYDDFLFVVRHNKTGKNYFLRKNYLRFKLALILLGSVYRRIKKFLGI